MRGALKNLAALAFALICGAVSAAPAQQSDPSVPQLRVGIVNFLRPSHNEPIIEPTLQLLHWKPWSWGQWGSLTGAAKYSGAGCPYHSMKGALLVILCMGSFELCSVQPTEGCVKPWHPSHLTERNSMTKSPTAA